MCHHSVNVNIIIMSSWCHLLMFLPEATLIKGVASFQIIFYFVTSYMLLPTCYVLHVTSYMLLPTNPTIMLVIGLVAMKRGLSKNYCRCTKSITDLVNRCCLLSTLTASWCVLQRAWHSGSLPWPVWTSGVGTLSPVNILITWSLCCVILIESRKTYLLVRF